MAEIKVTPSLLREHSAKFRTYSNNCQNIMNQLKSELGRMRGCWEGQAATTFFAKFDKLAANFPAYSNKMQQYSTYLSTAATEYASTEDGIRTQTQNAAELNNPLR